MNKINTNKILEKLFKSNETPPLTDSVVDAFLSTEIEHPKDKVLLMRQRFVNQVLENLPKTITPQLQEKQSFGNWLKNIRKKLQLTHQDIANQLGKDTSYIEDIEKGSLLPWQLKLHDTIEIVRLFKIHFTALVELFQISFVIDQGRNGLNIAARNESNSNNGIQNGIEYYLANKTEKVELSSEIEDYLNNLKDTFEREEMTEFLD